MPIRNGMNVSAACGASPKRSGVDGMATGLRPRPLPAPPAPATAHAATAYAATATATAPGTSLERMAVLDRFPAPLSTQEIVPAVADDPVVLSICAGLEGGLAAELRATLRAAVDERLVILDLSEVGRIDIAGVGVVIGGIRGMHEHGGRAAIVARPGPVLELLGKVGVTRLAPVFTEFDEAQENLRHCGRPQLSDISDKDACAQRLPRE